MDFGFNEEQELFRQSIARFVEEEAPREATREWDRAHAFPMEVVQKAAKNGWCGITLPDAYGGAGLDTTYQTIFYETLARYTQDLAVVIGLTNWGANSIARHGTEDQKARYLPKVCGAELRFSFGLTEPNSGSDAAALQTRATREGESYLLRGSKMFTTGAHLPGTRIMVAARTDPKAPKQQGISFFITDTRLPGVTVNRLETVGRWIAGTNEVVLEDVRLPVAERLGEENSGWSIVLSQLATERIATSACYLGTGQAAVTDAIQYANEREQFGKPIGKHQAIAHKIADMQTMVDAARLLTYRAAWAVDAGRNALLETSMAKLFSGEMAQKVTSDGMQILGGYAYMMEYDMQRYWREARNATVGGGTSEIQRNIISRQLGL